MLLQWSTQPKGHSSAPGRGVHTLGLVEGWKWPVSVNAHVTQP